MTQQIYIESTGEVHTDFCRIENLTIIQGGNMPEAYETIRRENEALKRELKQMKSTHKAMVKEYELENAALTAELIRMRKAAGVPEREGVNRNLLTENVDGWTLHKGKDGYFRLFKRHRGKIHGIYLGKYPDRERAEEKIREKERMMDACNMTLEDLMGIR